MEVHVQFEFNGRVVEIAVIEVDESNMMFLIFVIFAIVVVVIVVIVIVHVEEIRVEKVRQEEGAIGGEGVTDEEEVVAGGEEIGPVQDGVEVLVRCHFWLFCCCVFFDFACNRFSILPIRGCELLRHLHTNHQSQKKFVWSGLGPQGKRKLKKSTMLAC